MHPAHIHLSKAKPRSALPAIGIILGAFSATAWAQADGVSEAPPPKAAPQYQAPPRPSDGQNMVLTIEKLTDGFDPPRPLLIWAIGSSFTRYQGHGKQLIAMIRHRFPDAPPIEYRRMVGGSTNYRFTRGWARHLVIPDQPDVVLIYNFGDTNQLEKLIAELRAHTTADIIVPTLHWCRPHQPIWPDPEATNHHQDPAAIRALCQRYGVEFVDNRREMTQYMVANDLEIADLLADTVHQSPYAAKMINLNIARHFHRSKRPGYDPRAREQRIEVESRPPVVTCSSDWKLAENGLALQAGKRDSWMEVAFTGTRIDLIAWQKQSGGRINVWIDGTPAQIAPVYHATFVKPAKNNVPGHRHRTDRCPHGIDLMENIVPQHWTITMTSDTGDYRLAGDVTGYDGVGNASKPFTSKSGQIRIPPQLWRSANTNRIGDRFTFEVLRSTQDQINLAGPREKYRIRLVENLSHGEHTLRLELAQGGPVTIDAFDVFNPPGTTMHAGGD